MGERHRKRNSIGLFSVISMYTTRKGVVLTYLRESYAICHQVKKCRECEVTPGSRSRGTRSQATATWLPSFPSFPFDPDMSGLDVIPHQDDAAPAEEVPGDTPVSEGKGGDVWDASLSSFSFPNLLPARTRYSRWCLPDIRSGLGRVGWVSLVAV